MTFDPNFSTNELSVNVRARAMLPEIKICYFDLSLKLYQTSSEINTIC